MSSAHRLWVFETTFTFVGMALSVDLECKFHGHVMNPFRMLHKLCKHHSTSDVSDLICIRSPDGIPVCRVRIGSPELHRRDHKQSYDRLSTHGSNEKEISHGRCRGQHAEVISQWGVGFIVWLDLFEVKLKIFEWPAIEPKFNCILTFRIAPGNLNVLNVKRVNLGRSPCATAQLNFACECASAVA